ncbi:MAG: hypothetical protein IT558_03175 [Alphaproteobacteria bacterium]|nr:hypothetical protein [Alphaproteobacteria bacterium]
MSLSPRKIKIHCDHEQGNMLFMILIAVVLIGALTAAIMQSGNTESASVDKETIVIRVSETQRTAGELEKAVLYILNNSHSEADIRFAHPDAPSSYGDLSADADPADQVFAPSGGAATYPKVPDGINDGSKWEFYGGTAIPGVGSDRADLIAVLPRVTQQFCDRVNQLNGQSVPEDTGASAAAGPSPGNCLFQGAVGRFNDTQQFYGTPNTTDAASFTQDPEISAARPAQEACVLCELDGKNHFYHVLLAR